MQLFHWNKILVRAVGLFTLVAIPTAATPTGRNAEQLAIENALLPANLIAGEAPVTATLEDSMSDLGVAGVSIAVIEDGRIAWAHAYGRTHQGGPPTDTDTLFQAASISKPVAVMAALRLSEAGLLDLDNDVNRALHSWKLPDSPYLSVTPVTPRQLMNHTAGTTVHGFAGYSAGAPVPTLLQILNGAAPANSEAVVVDQVPGSAFRYSGGGTMILQLLMEEVSGEAFPYLMRRLVLEPTGMKRSLFLQPLTSELAENAAAPHDATGSLIMGGARQYPELAAAGLWTTAMDLARLALDVQASLSGTEGALLKPETARAMLTPGGKGGWGLGFQVGGSTAKPWFQHAGGNAGFRGLLFSYADGDGIVVLANGDQGDALAEMILRTIATSRDWPDFQPRQRRVINLAVQDMERLVGDYKLGATGMLSISRRGGELFAVHPAIGESELLAESTDQLFWRNRDMDAQFTLGDHGNAIKVSIRLGARKFEAERVDVGDAHKSD
jgi:CubicO group peptidase (beta-lactamase class C family)